MCTANPTAPTRYSQCGFTGPTAPIEKSSTKNGSQVVGTQRGTAPVTSIPIVSVSIPSTAPAMKGTPNRASSHGSLSSEPRKVPIATGSGAFSAARLSSSSTWTPTKPHIPASSSTAATVAVLRARRRSRWAAARKPMAMKGTATVPIVIIVPITAVFSAAICILSATVSGRSPMSCPMIASAVLPAAPSTRPATARRRGKGTVRMVGAMSPVTATPDSAVMSRPPDERRLPRRCATHARAGDVPHKWEPGPDLTGTSLGSGDGVVVGVGPQPQGAGVVRERGRRLAQRVDVVGSGPEESARPGIEVAAGAGDDELDHVGDVGPLGAVGVHGHPAGHLRAHDAGGHLEGPQTQVVSGRVHRGTEPQQRRLARVVRRVVGRVTRRGARREVDHPPAAALDHARHHGLQAVERPAHVGLDHVPPLGRLRLPDRHRVGLDHPGVVDEKIDGADGHLDPLDGSPDLLEVTDVGSGDARRCADALHRVGGLAQGGLVPAEDADVHTHARQALGDRPPDATGRPSHERDPSGHRTGTHAPRSTAPHRRSASATAAVRTAAVSSAVKVRSGARIRRLNASEVRPAATCSPEYTSNRRTCSSSAPPPSTRARSTSAAGTEASTTSATSCRATGYVETGAEPGTTGARPRSTSRSSSNAWVRGGSSSRDSTAGCSSPAVLSRLELPPR